MSELRLQYYLTRVDTNSKVISSMKPKAEVGRLQSNLPKNDGKTTPAPQDHIKAALAHCVSFLGVGHLDERNHN